MGVKVESGTLDKHLDNLIAKLNPMGLQGYGGWLAGPANHYLQLRVRRLFKENEKGSDLWPPLAPATVEIRKHRGYNGPTPINYRTGQLYRLLTATRARIIPDGGGITLMYPGSGAERQSNIRRLKQAQGTLIQRNGRPSTPRPVIIPLAPDDMAALIVSFDRWFRMRARGARR